MSKPVTHHKQERLRIERLSQQSNIITINGERYRVTYQKKEAGKWKDQELSVDVHEIEHRLRNIFARSTSTIQQQLKTAAPSKDSIEIGFNQKHRFTELTFSSRDKTGRTSVSSHFNKIEEVFAKNVLTDAQQRKDADLACTELNALASSLSENTPLSRSKLKETPFRTAVAEPPAKSSKPPKPAEKDEPKHAPKPKKAKKAEKSEHTPATSSHQKKLAKIKQIASNGFVAFHHPDDQGDQGIASFLGNFYHAPFIFRGHNMQCSEAAYQAGIDPDKMNAFSKLSGQAAFKLGRRTKANNTWKDPDGRHLQRWKAEKGSGKKSRSDSWMKEALREKFRQNDELRELLLATEDAYLVEHVPEDRAKTEKYWGDGFNGKGINVLGKMLMQVRDELRGKTPTPIRKIQPPDSYKKFIKQENARSKKKE